jgi:hypothetical protein
MIPGEEMRTPRQEPKSKMRTDSISALSQCVFAPDIHFNFHRLFYEAEWR